MNNLMDQYISFLEKSFLKYYKMVYDKLFNKEIAERYIDTYLNVRYSNYVDEESIKLPVVKKITRALDFTRREMLEEYDETLVILIDSYRNFANHLYNLDQLYLLEAQKKTITEITDERSKILGVNDSKFMHQLSEALRLDIKKKKEFLEAFDSNTFKLDFCKLSKNDYGVKLVNNISFPEIYSDIAIRKAREKSNVNEDLASISFLQISTVIINDLIECSFDKNYYLYLPSSFFEKKTKLNRIIHIIDNIYIQESLKMVITFECFMKYKLYVMEYMRQGFMFAIYLDESFDYCTDNIEFLELFDKILLEKKKYYFKDMKNNGKIRDRIISVDEVK